MTRFQLAVELKREGRCLRYSFRLVMSEAGKTLQTSNSWLCAGELFSVTSTLFISVKLHFSLVCTLKSGRQWNCQLVLIS